MAIKLTYKNTEYELMYTRNTIKRMESLGFELQALERKPATMIPLLFQGAFFAKHSRIDQSLVDEIFNNTRKMQDLTVKLAEMYVNTLSFLHDDENENEEKNVSWEVI